MPAGLFTSYAQNAEDVVLRRALGHVQGGRYIDVGAFDPVVHSVTKQLYDAGWRGLNLEPVPALHAAMVRGRPEDVNLQVAVGAEPGTLRFHVVSDTGLSTLRDDVAAHPRADGREVQDIEVEVVTLDSLIAEHLPGEQVHLLKVDVEGAEAAVLAGIDLAVNRPWVLVVEATEPLSVVPTHQGWEPGLLAAGYELCLFDGLSRWYVAAEQAEALRPALSYSACTLDDWVPFEQVRAGERAARLEVECELWRSETLRHAVRNDSLAKEVAQLRWRIRELEVEPAQLRPLLDEAVWQRGLLTDERDWLRGLLVQEKQRADRATATSLARFAGNPGVRVARRAYRGIAGRRRDGQDGA